MNTTSGAGLYGNVGQSAYGAAKAAIANLTLVTALEMGRYDVTANAISPVAATRMTATVGAAATDATADDDVWHPMDPGNSSPVVAYLASKASGWLSGQVLRIEGNAVRRVRTWEVEPGEYVAASGARLDAGELVDGLRTLYGAMPRGLDAAKSLGLLVSGEPGRVAGPPLAGAHPVQPAVRLPGDALGRRRRPHGGRRDRRPLERRRVPCTAAWWRPSSTPPRTPPPSPSPTSSPGRRS